MSFNVLSIHIILNFHPFDSFKLVSSSTRLLLQTYLIYKSIQVQPDTHFTMTNFTYRNGVSLAEIIVYVPALIVAICLCTKHGFGKSSGWFFLIIFCLARIIGPCMQLATISAPTNVALYTGSAILNNVGVSPLEMAALGFLSRLLTSIQKSHSTFIQPLMLRGVQLVILVALVLGIKGGLDAADSYTSTGVYRPVTLNKVGTALLVVSYVLLVLFTAITYLSLHHAETGEKRLFLAIVLSLPFLLVRLVYSCFSTFSTKHVFNLLSGSTTILLCVALVEEMVVVGIFECMGLTLRKSVKEEQDIEARQVESEDSGTPMQGMKVGGGVRSERQVRRSGGGGGGRQGDSTLLRIAKKSLIGRVVMAVVPDKQEAVEMQRGYVQRR